MTKDVEHAEKFCQDLRDAVKAAINGVTASALAEVRAAKSPAALAGALRNLGRLGGNVVTAAIKVRGKPVTTMENVANYIYAEMMTNYNSSVSKFISAMNEAAKNESTIFNAVGSMAVWTYKVMPRQPKEISDPAIAGEWDHKPMINEQWGLYSYDRAPRRLYRWDIWSNIHYGFVGAAVGYNSDVLLLGASAANVLSSMGK